MTAERPTHSELVRALVKPGVFIVASLTPEKADLWHAATGISGEAAELLSCIYESWGRENLCEEAGDLFFYVEQLRQNIQIQLDWNYISALAERTIDSASGLAINVSIFAGDALDIVKKSVIYNKDLDVKALESQLTNMLISLMALLEQHNISRHTCLEANITKLLTRYEGMKYSDAAAQARADKEEEK